MFKWLAYLLCDHAGFTRRVDMDAEIDGPHVGVGRCFPVLLDDPWQGGVDHHRQAQP